MFGRKKGGVAPPVPSSTVETLANSPVRDRGGLLLKRLQPARPQPPTLGLVAPPRTHAIPAAPRPLAGLGATAAVEQNPGKVLVVGRAIALSGEIDACEKLVVEGRVNAELHRCRDIEVARTGRFSGVAEVDNAEIVGRFDGELTARKVFARASARISGKLRYGEMLVEPGAQIRGDIAPLEPDVLGEEPA
jgi:cytoskeletal protein CcmA (bactofilin family)